VGHGTSDTHERVRALVLETLEAAGLQAEQVGEDRWMTQLSGEWKRTIPVLLQVDERTLRVRSLFCGPPDERHDEVYALLLHRNERPAPVHFALDDDGAVLLLGHVPLDALDAAALDELLGAVLAVSDETFNAVLRAGFATYLANEQAWRAGAGLPPNPIGQPAD
jgi:hypothetical protein